MLTISQWLTIKAEQYTNNIYLVDATRSVTYSENLKTTRALTSKLDFVKPQDAIVYLGGGSIESYQLYFATLLLRAVWVPIDFRLEIETLTHVIREINPALIIYDDQAADILKNQTMISRRAVSDIFSKIDTAPQPREEEADMDHIISMYLTSGSTGLPKIVKHNWYATLQHAAATIDRYKFTQESRLFNRRQVFGVSGAFPLVTLMHCGGSIVVPNSDLSKEMDSFLLDCALLMREKEATHVSFFPSEMLMYAELLEKDPQLIPLKLQRITTGGEAVEFSDLLRVSRALATNRICFDYLWRIYPYLGDGATFSYLKLLYEAVNGPLVQVTQTYGATELTCNAIANPPQSGPDYRGVGSAINSIHLDIVDEQGVILPKDGKAIGRLRVYGSTVASGYLREEASLTRNCYQTNDLASININGQVTFFGRSENLIRLPGEETMVNPLIIERELKKVKSVKTSLVFEQAGKLHAAILATDDKISQANLIRDLKRNSLLTSVNTISIWERFPLALGGKVDKKAVINLINTGEQQVISLDQVLEVAHENDFSWCQVC